MAVGCGKNKDEEVIGQTNRPSYICSEVLIYFLNPSNKSVIFQMKECYILQDTESWANSTLLFTLKNKWGYDVIQKKGQYWYVQPEKAFSSVSFFT